ncbi:hypothetical protein D8M04_12140 [Oceanobacillus piezotolerans]|uniref:Group-specific protein n=1 Tax=Oceanobacillus piezotolerans TaxID=2448030 RepID=A0A498D910_9BACI|nr:hypothetical protein [Oceanobacillus piezotolerans]RLL43667.1 hypothetical protein D8M04_12140 [Oceanobacillus piezotolerans]
MLKKIGILIFILFILCIPVTAFAKPSQIEVFDIEKGEVTKKVEMNPSIQAEVEMFLENINEAYHKFDPIPKEGKLIRVPLQPSVTVENEWVHTLIDEVIIISPKSGEPHLMLFDDENNIHFFNFKYEGESFWKKIK